MKKLLFIYLILLFCSVYPASGQVSPSTYPVQTNINFLPPYSLYLSDYCNSGRDKLNLVLRNRDLQEPELHVKLHLSIKAGNGLIMETRDYNDLPVFTLYSGMPYRVSAGELCPYFDSKNLLIQGVLSGGRLPEGPIEICVQVLDAYTNRPLSFKSCAMAWMTLNYPPLLTQPARNQEIPFRDPLNLFFHWTPRHQSLSGVEYVFTLKEIYDRYAPVESAFAYSPTVYSGTQYGTSLAYTGMYPPLIEGVRYAWQVRAIVRDGFEELNLFENNGYSEIFTFDIGKNANQPIVWDDGNNDDGKGDDGGGQGDDGQGDDGGKDDDRKDDDNKGGDDDKRGDDDDNKDPGGGGKPKEDEKEEPKECIPPTGVSGIEDKGQLKVTWSPIERVSNYFVAFRAKDLEGSSWMATSTSQTYAYLNNLRRGVTYEYRVGVRCSDGSTVYGDIYEFLLPDRSVQIATECGKIPQINFENQDPIPYLNPGDVVMVGDFKMTLTEVSGGNGNFTGKGWINIPLLLEMKVAVGFSGIRVNTNQQMIAGKVETIYDKTEGQIGDLDNVKDDLEDFADQIRILFDLAKTEHEKGNIPDDDFREIEDYKEQSDTLSNRKKELEGNIQNLKESMNNEQDAQKKEEIADEISRNEAEQSQVEEKIEEVYEKISKKMEDNGYGGGQVKDVKINSSFMGVISFESSGNNFPLNYPNDRRDGIPMYDQGKGAFITGETTGDYIEDSFGNYQIYFTTTGSSKISEVDALFAQGRPSGDLCMVWLHFDTKTKELGFIINYGDQFFGKEFPNEIKSEFEKYFIGSLANTIKSDRANNVVEKFFNSLVSLRHLYSNYPEILIPVVKGILVCDDESSFAIYDGDLMEINSLKLGYVYEFQEFFDSNIYDEEIFADFLTDEVASHAYASLRAEINQIHFRRTGIISSVSPEFELLSLGLGAVFKKITVKFASKISLKGLAPKAFYLAIREALGKSGAKGGDDLVWNYIKATQEVYPGSVLPKSFELTTPTNKIWVHPNATEHIAEFIQMKATNFTPEAVRLATQQELRSLHSAVSESVKNGITYDKLLEVGGWELKFSAARESGQLPALIHARLIK